MLQLVSGLYYITRDTGCNTQVGAKLYSLGRAKVFSSVATNFGLKTTGNLLIIPYQMTKFQAPSSNSF